MSNKKFFFIAALSVMMASCHAPKKVPYLVDAENVPQYALNQVNTFKEPLIVPGDLLNIRVYASNPAAVAQFNKNQYLDETGHVIQLNNNMNNNGNSSESATDYYLVDASGDIEFPIIGPIHVAGKTKQEICEYIKDCIYPKYIKIVPSVDLRLMNFKVTVLGQVNSPGVVTSSNERLNILEALAKAGDLHIQGDRENILLIRTNADGSREVHRLNIHESSLLTSPYFNLQQNDFIYVTPNRSAAQNSWQMHQGWTSTVAVIGGVSSIAALVIGIINLSK